ncbi:DNAJ protein JJJ1 homolog [Rosa rugosa]|uniref:DNAJ protein JJJ1 homolog n=1 Tax=Rosa rugosa TaxID=74645 RepID=UPI002B40A0AD|nr:DNAJ protein JJJ1 homolog [Rosa rugosa]
MAKREEERKREMEKERERRKRLKKEKLAKATMEYEEPEWTKVVERKRKYGDPGDEKEKEREEWECVVCRKGFRSEKQCRNHEQSKKHLLMVMELMKLKHYDMVAELIEVERNYEDLNEEEDLMEEKRNEVVDDGVGGSDSNENEFSDCDNENQKERVSEVVEVDELEVEEEEDEMNVLEAMVAIEAKGYGKGL